MRWVLFIAMVLIVGKCHLACGPGSSGVLARLDLGEQGKYMVTQTWTGSYEEPYTVRFWMQPPEHPNWRSYELTFGTRSWRDAQLDFNPEKGKVTASHDGEDLAVYYIKEKMYAESGYPNTPPGSFILFPSVYEETDAPPFKF